MAASDVKWMPPDRFDEYRLIQVLGRGSMGQVWLAHDTVLDRLVAVKFISELPTHDAVHQRFLTEARAAARVQHPNIIAIYRVGEIGARPYLISEYVRGNSLDRIARPVPGPRLLPIALGLARGLAAAHRCGVLHRDLKPANAIVSEAGEVKLLDFGLAKLVQEAAPPGHNASGDAGERGDTDPRRERDDSAESEATRGGAEADRGAPTIKVITETQKAETSGGGLALPDLTRTGAVMGTPAYMPPETWRGEAATARSDVYSLGALLYELAAGIPPHRGDSQQVVRTAAIGTDAPPLAALAPEIDPRLAAIIDRCLRRDPAERPASGDAVREALERLTSRDAVREPAAAPGADGDATSRDPVVASRGAASTAPPVHAAATRAPRRWRPMIAVITVLAAFAGVAIMVKQPRGRTHAGAAPGGCSSGMIAIPAGRFAMGSPDGEGDADEHPRHDVTLSAYCIDRTEVTVAAYWVCVATGGCGAPSMTVNWPSYSTEEVARFSHWCTGGDRLDHPINCVDWDEAAAYCAWRGARLPTEAEWEYAARGGDGRTHPWGNDAPSASRLNACGSECMAMARRERIPWKAMHDGDDGWPTTAPVGRYPQGASPFGALDMAGNVWEWTADWYSPYAAPAQTDPAGPTAGTSRVSRGGGWTSGGEDRARASDRDWMDPKVREASLGFRCAGLR